MQELHVVEKKHARWVKENSNSSKPDQNKKMGIEVDLVSMFLIKFSVRNLLFDFVNRLREIVGELGRRMAAQVTELGTLKANYKDIKWQVTRP